MVPIPRENALAASVTVLPGLALVSAALLRARHSRYPAILYTSAAYMALLHLVWLAALLQVPFFGGPYLASGFAALELLTFPWSFAVSTNMSMAGFDTLPALLLNYARFVLGFGGLQCLVLTLLVWEFKLKPRPRARPRSTRF